MSTQYVTFRIGEALYGVEVMRISETLGHHARTPVPYRSMTYCSTALRTRFDSTSSWCPGA